MEAGKEEPYSNDEVVMRMESFHIRTVWHALDDNLTLEHDPAPASPSSTPLSTASSGSYRTALAEAPISRPRSEVSVPPSLDGDDISLEEAYEPTRRIPLPTPQPGRRPCWEPPLLDYSDFADVIQAHQTIVEREGRANIAVRTDLLDLGIEYGLNEDYTTWTHGRKTAVLDGEQDRDDEYWFWYGLGEELRQDVKEVRRDFDELEERIGGQQLLDSLVNTMDKEIKVIQRERGLVVSDSE